MGGRRLRVHVRNSGRLRERLTPGRVVRLEPATAPGRRIPFSLVLVRMGEGFISTHAQPPNDPVAEGLDRQRIPGFRGWQILRRGPPPGPHRLDFLLGRGSRRCVLREPKDVDRLLGSRLG